jgi:hypothetical protein
LQVAKHSDSTHYFPPSLDSSAAILVFISSISCSLRI